MRPWGKEGGPKELIKQLSRRDLFWLAHRTLLELVIAWGVR